MIPPEEKIIEECKLPPLDILMVWHAFLLLNPRAYAEDCRRFQVHVIIWNTEFPWKLINEHVDSNYRYKVSQKHQAYFESITGVSWNNLDDDTNCKQKNVQCVSCLSWLGVSFCDDSNPKKSTDSSSSFQNIYTNTSYVGRWVKVDCPNCKGIVTHDLLRVANFFRDFEAFKTKGTCLPGTLVNEYTGLLNFPTKALLVYQMFEDTIVKSSLRAYSKNVLWLMSSQHWSRLLATKAEPTVGRRRRQMDLSLESLCQITGTIHLPS